MKHICLAFLFMFAAFGCAGGNITRDCPSNMTSCDLGCTSLETDDMNCGACGTACGTNQQCVASQCQCSSGMKLCTSGCVDANTDEANCGECGTTCGTGQMCMNGSCQCPPGQMHCNGSCVDTQTDEANCGQCGMACAVGTNCVTGLCGCPGTTTECGSACVDTNTDEAHCGDCITSCNGGKFCDTGDCVCPSDRSDCSGNCVDKLTDNANCGQCGFTCMGGKSCTTGNCVCTGGQSDCNGTCVNKQTDNANCGFCGTTCSGGKTCQAGNCLCPAGQTDCGGTCFDLTVNNDLHCGSCAACTGGKTCQALTCQCPVGQNACSGTCYTTTTDRLHCGAGCGTCTGAQLCNNGCVSAPTLSIATKWESPTGWTVFGGAAIQMTFTLTPAPPAGLGITYRCRTYLKGTAAPAFTNCDAASSGAAAQYSPPVGGSGTYITEVIYLQGGTQVGSSASYEYYAHTSLNGVKTCSLPFSDATYFNAATAYNTSFPAAFPIPATLFTADATLNLKNPFIAIPFKTVNISPSMALSGAWPGFPKNYTTKDLSLRHKFQLDPTNKLLMMKRQFVRSVKGGCQNMATWHHAGTFNFGLCDAFITNINGLGLCVGTNSAGTGVEVKGPPYVAGWFRFRTVRYPGRYNGNAGSSYCTTVGCAGTLPNVFYLPP
jgi:hypothetical protein